MKCLIVNADDFGASRGINRGILEAFRSGILTSASLLVNAPWSEEAATLSRSVPEMSVGLHADLTHRENITARDSLIRSALARQISAFEKLMGRMPTHLDSHRNIHHDL